MSRTVWRRRKFWAGLFSLALIGELAAQQAENPPQKPPAQETQAQSDTELAKGKSPSGKIVVPAGTRLPLVLHNSISTRSAKPGDAVYLETLFPIVVENRVVIPAGSYVSGEVLESKRPGRVKGRGELMLRLNTMILPNGYSVEFKASPTGAGTGGEESVEHEGKIKGPSDKASDVGTVITLTSVGAGIGGLAGRSGRAAGIGAAAGAGAGLTAVLLSRGPELVMPRGTTLDVVLDRPLYLDANRVEFTDPGRASSLAGPSNREPQRRRFPY
jgi:type IV secretion system protein VirB10